MRVVLTMVTLRVRLRLGGELPLFAVLFVCEGNQCRSPAAEQVLRAWLAAPPAHGLMVESMSAGTRAAEGLPIHPLTAHAMTQAGFDVPRHSSTRVSPGAVGSADLILTADRSQRSVVAAMAEGAAGRTFTLLEFAALSATIQSRDLPMAPHGLVAEAALTRGPAWNDPAHDLPDPISDGPEQHSAVFAQVARASAELARALIPRG